jgi:hypothetical protein
VLEHMGDQNGSIGVHSMQVDENGALESREANFPLNFTFKWHESNFEGTVNKLDDGFNLILGTTLAHVPYSAEDAERRTALMAEVSDENQDSPRLEIENGNRLVFSRQIELAEHGGMSADNLITNLAIIVLTAAPRLDAIAKFGPA